MMLGLVLFAIAGWAQAQSRCGLGTKWDVTESGHRMTWTRQGNSNVFSVTGTVNGTSFTAEQRITITGNKVSVDRYRASDENTCTFEGTIQEDGVTVIGTYDCTKYKPSSGWRATISCGETVRCGLGRVWDETESGHRMTWTRQGNSNVFSVTGTVNGTSFTAEQRITITGNKVSVDRYRASDGNTCTFEGTIQEDGVTVIGTYDCTKYKPSSGWKATIRCN